MTPCFYLGAAAGSLAGAACTANIDQWERIAALSLLLLPCFLFQRQNFLKKIVCYLASALTAGSIFFIRYQNPEQTLRAAETNFSRTPPAHFTLKITEAGKARSGWYQTTGELVSHEGLYLIIKSRQKKQFIPDSRITIPADYTSVFSMPKTEYRSYLIAGQILGIVKLKPTDKIIIDEAKGAGFIYYRLKKKLWEKLTAHMDPHYAAISFALITGDKSQIHKKIKDGFRITGTYHVLAVSGMHAGILSAICYAFFRFLQFRKQSCAALLFFAVFPFYLFLTGFQISIVRTFLMLFIGWIIVLTGRKTDPLYIFVFTALLFIISSPSILYNISFQLSFTAVLGILTALKVSSLYKIKNKAAAYLLISIGAQLGTAPVLIYSFGYINYFTIVYNLVVTTVLPLILIYSMFMPLLPSAAAAVTGDTLSLLIGLLYKFIEISAVKLDIFNVSLKGNFLFAAAFWSLFLFGFFILIRKKQKEAAKKRDIYLPAS